MKACYVKGTNLLQDFDFPIYVCKYMYMDFSCSMSKMKYVIALITHSLETFCFNKKFLHGSENRCVCMHRK